MVLLPFLVLSARAGRLDPRTGEDAPSKDAWNALNMESQAVLGELQLQTGDVNRAQRTFERSLDLGTRVRGPRAEVAAQSHYRMAEIAAAKGDVPGARRNLEILVQRYPDSDWAARAKSMLETLPGGARKLDLRPDEPYVPALPSSSPEEALARLRSAISDGRTEAALLEAYEFRRRYPSRSEVDEVALAAGALHLRRGEAAKAARLLRPLSLSGDPALRSKALHLLGAALASLGLDEAALKIVPAADPAATRDRWLALAQTWRAAALDRLGRPDEAAELYRAISASGQESPVKAYAVAAIAADWDRRGRTERARDALARAEDEARKWVIPELAESAALSRAALLQRDRAYGDAAKAYADFASRYARSPLLSQALFQQALCLRRLGKPEEAAAALRDLLAREPGSAYATDAHLMLGQLDAEGGRTESALAQYRAMAKASEGPDADRQALLLMAQLYYNQKRWSEAAPLYRRWLDGAPQGAKTREVEGLLLVSAWQADKDDPTLPALVKAYPDHPLVPQIRWDLATKAYRRGDWAGADALFARDLEDAPDGPRAPEALFFRAECLRRLERKDDAVKAYKASLAKAPAGPRAADAAMRLGALLFEAGDADGAAKAYARVKTGPGAAEAAYDRALALAKGGEDAQTIAAWEDFAKRFPKHERAASAWWQAGRLAEERSDPERAAADYARVRSGPDEAKALYALGRLEERRERKARAKAAYERLRALEPPGDPARLSGLLRLGLMLELEDKPRAAAPLYLDILKRADKTSATFETARKRLEALSADKSLLGAPR